MEAVNNNSTSKKIITSANNKELAQKIKEASKRIMEQNYQLYNE